MRHNKELASELSESIHAADRDILEQTILSMCKTSPECLLQATDVFLVNKSLTSAGGRGGIHSGDEEEDEDEDDEDGDGDRPENDSTEPSAKKRKIEQSNDIPELIARYRTCLRCEKLFDVTKNDKTACKTHDGMKEIDVECFPDDDQVELEPNSINVDTDWRVDAFPEGFIWDCCDKPANHPGCNVFWHQA